MKMAKYDDSEGVWRTIGGRRVFIRTGQSLSDAMIESGKFKNLRSDYKKAKEEENKSKNISASEFADELINADVGDWNNMSQAERDKVCEGILRDFEEKYGNKLEDEKFRKEVLNTLEDQNFHTMRKIIDQKYEYSGDATLKDLDKRIEQSKAKEDDEYELYKKARENEDSIDPMTENSTDWEQLDKKYKERYEKETKEKLNQEETNTKKAYEEYKKNYDYEKEMPAGAKFSKMLDESGVKSFGDEIEEQEQLTKFGEKKEFTREELKARYGTDDVDLINAGRESENRVKLKEDNKTETTFTSQSTNPFYDDTTYSKEQLDKMAENKIKPMKNTYSGRGWEGTNYDSNLSTKDIAKNISDYSKKEFPDVKLSRRTDYNSMDINIMSSDKDLYVSTSDIDKMSDKQISDTIRDSAGGYTRLDDWLNENNRKTANGTFTAKDERDYLKEELSTYKSRNGNRAVGDEWYLSDYGKKVVSGLNKEMNSYNFDDDDPMTDYFHSNFYGYVYIGKWDKPYAVKETTANSKMNDTIRQKAFQKYKKEHPGTEKTLEDFM